MDNKIPVQTILPDISEEWEIILELKTILETRNKQLGNRAITKYLVKWKNPPVEEETWEYEFFMQKHQRLVKCWGKHLFEWERFLKP